MGRARQAKRNFAVLWGILLAGALIGGFGGGEAGDATNAASLVGHTPRPMAHVQGAMRDRPPVLIAAGDIADCGSPAERANVRATAALVRDIAGIVATLGDHVYDAGSRREFAECYDPSWGTEKDRTRPAPGNHDYETRGARGYFAYFGDAAGDTGKGYYSYDLGAWHIVALNSNCDEVGGCGASSPQGRWLRRDLAAHPARCTLAYWHHSLFSSGEKHGGDDAVKPFWEILSAAGADVVLSGHEHHYERFAPQDAEGTRDRQRGIRQFIVGTGGAGLYAFDRPLRTSEVREAGTFGVLVLTLRRTSYDWEFVPVEARPGPRVGRPFTDAGSGHCH